MEKLILKEKKWSVDKVDDLNERLRNDYERNRQKIDINYTDLTTRIVSISAKNRVNGNNLDAFLIQYKLDSQALEKKFQAEIDERIY